MVQLLEKLYEKLWRRVGGRPWTEIVRDEEKKSPLIFMLICPLFQPGLDGRNVLLIYVPVT